MRCDALEKYIADRFGVSVSNVSRTLNTWINFLYHTLKQLPIWPSSKVIKDTMPKCFKDQYPDTRVILDCTEIFIEIPSSFRAQSQTYSTFKSHNTAKGLIGIAPNGFVTFISDLYGGHILVSRARPFTQYEEKERVWSSSRMRLVSPVLEFLGPVIGFK